MPICTPGDPTLVMGKRIRSILIFWLFITTNDCFTNANPGLAALKNFDLSRLPGMTAQDLANIVSALETDAAGNNAFSNVRDFYASVLTTGGANSYMKSAEAIGNHYTDHNCPGSIEELMKSLIA